MSRKKCRSLLNRDEFGIVVRGLLSSVYLYSAFDKIYLLYQGAPGLQPLIIRYYLGSFSAYALSGGLKFFADCTLILVTIVELALAILVWRRLKIGTLFVFAVLLHLLMFMVIPVGTFSLLMILLWILALDDTAFSPG